jgi:hypothetical protein
MTINNPFDLPWHAVGLELIVLLLAALTFRHAMRDHAGRLTWLTIFVYGLAMELLSYSFVDNFAHGTFTVMFYGDQLPLYITVIYPVLLYTGIATARSLGMRPAAEAVTAGFLIVLMDAPFDMVGPEAGWWRWFDTDPNIAHRWLGVPVTSYYWHLGFGGILAYLTGRAARQRSLGWAMPCVIGTIVLGVAAFLPFHGLSALGVSHGVIVALALAGAAAVSVLAPRRGGFAPALLALWIPFYGFHALVAMALVLR